MPDESVPTSPWEESVCFKPTERELLRLFAGDIAGICIHNFMTASECALLSNKFNSGAFREYINVSPAIGSLGVTVFEYDGIGKAAYFKAAAKADEEIQKIEGELSSPFEKVMKWLHDLLPDYRIAKAFEPQYGAYFAGLARRIERGTLIHIDVASIEQPNWAVAQALSQLAFNLYVDVPAGQPGIVKVWNRSWQEGDSKYKIPETYGYNESVIQHYPSALIKPEIGMLMLINTRKFHQVLPSTGVRLTISAALGLLTNKEVIVWS